MYVEGRDFMQEARSKIIENKEEKKRKLVDAAFELFTDKGFKSTSIQEIFIFILKINMICKSIWLLKNQKSYF